MLIRKKYDLFAFMLFALTFCSNRLMANDIKKPVDYVSTLVGTLSSFELSNGNTYPIISMPWGMNSWTPQTGKMGDGWQYSYNAIKIRGLKQTHQPSPWINDYGQFAVLPQVSENPKVNEDERASHFNHKAEKAFPYMYSVYLADYDTEVYLAPSERSAVLKTIFPASSKPKERWVVVDAFDCNSKIEKLNDYTIVGISKKNSGGVPENFSNYFVIKSKNKIRDYIQSDTITKEHGNHARIAFSIDTDEREQTLYMSSSFVSHSQALLNLKEVEGSTFEQVSEKCRSRWNEVLSRLYVEDNREDLKSVFYSNLYRCLLFPRNFSEIDKDNKRIHYSPYNGKIEKGYMYTDTGVWDTFRALFPLINLVYPDEAVKIQEGMLNSYKESHFFPEWASPGHRDCMVGNNSASVISDWIIKGICKKDDVKLMIEGLLHGANNNHPNIKSTGRFGYQYYNKLGYVPCDVGINESAARTLEYSYDDWCIYKSLQKTGYNKKEIALYAKKSNNYKKLFNKKEGWMSGRNQDGSFQKSFNPFKWGDSFTEGNAIHYTWSVFHDVKGLIDLMGGEKNFVSRLDTVFSLPPIFDDSYYGFPIHEIREMQIMNMGNYAHGNQPIQHMIYLYNYAGASYKCQKHIREVMSRLYSAMPDGYCGDEDNGQTSAWYVFSALGFYPVNPVSNQYIIGIPLFEKITIQLPGNKKTTIKTTDTKENYIQNITLDNNNHKNVYFTYDQLKNGAEITFNLGKNPSSWGKDSDKPYSFSYENK